MSKVLLKTVGLVKKFGGIVAVKNVSLEVEKETIVGLIGPNGAGKTTLINLITGNLRPDSGKVLYDGTDVTPLPTFKRIRLGIGRTFQITEIFKEMTVRENMLVPLTWMPNGWERERLIEDYLRFFEISHLSEELAGRLSGGQQKLLEIAMISILDPKIYLLDEPFYGVHPLLKNKIMSKIREMRDENGKTFLIVSHDVPLVMKSCDLIHVMSAGEIIASGPPSEVRSDEKVIQAYLGE